MKRREEYKSKEDVIEVEGEVIEALLQEGVDRRRPCSPVLAPDDPPTPKDATEGVGSVPEGVQGSDGA